jgi:phosphoglycolate phosphatase-like HAD superfamily hydrolase
MFQPEAIFLDGDGVILDSLPFNIGAYQAIARWRLLRVPRQEEIAATWGDPLSRVVDILWPGFGVDEFLYAYRHLGFDKESIPLVPGVAELLPVLSRDRFVAVISNRDRGSLKRLLERAGVLSMLKLVQGIEDSPFPKPDGRVFTAALTTANVSPHEALYVGDTLVDWRAAQAANIPFIGMTTGATSQKMFTQVGVQTVAASFSELMTLIL